MTIVAEVARLGLPVRVVPTYREFRFPLELERFARDNWKGKYSSLIPNADSIVSDGTSFEISASVTNYADQRGAIEAILQRKSFAPRGVNGLGVTTHGVTSDEKLILPRRSAAVKHAPLVYNAFSGWMTTVNLGIPREEGGDMRHSRDPRLYDVRVQAQRELEEESGLKPGDYSLEPNPLFLSEGLIVSFSPVFTFIGRLHKTADEVRKAMLKAEKFQPGETEHDKIAAVHVDDLEQLLRNQAQLQREDPRTYVSTDKRGRDLILVDWMIGDLLFGHQAITGKELQQSTIDYLGNNGIEVRVYDSPAEMIA